VSDVDLDRLADFADGLLDPGPAAEVAAKVRTDPAWASALAALRTANTEVSRSLRNLPAVPMPELVAARLDRALRAEATGTGTAPGTGTTAAATAGGAVVPLASRRTRRWPRVLAATAGVAAAAVAVGFAVVATGGFPNADRAATTAGGAGTSKSGSELGYTESLTGVRVVASGRDYTAATVAGAGLAAAPLAPGAAGTAAGTPYDAAPGPADARVPADLSALAAPPGRDACLRAVVAQFGGVPVLVDYARFDGRPALVIVLATVDRVVVAGPGCGQPGRGVDEIYTVPTR